MVSHGEVSRIVKLAFREYRRWRIMFFEGKWVVLELQFTTPQPHREKFNREHDAQQWLWDQVISVVMEQMK